MTNIIFIGAGSMTEALIQGLLKKGSVPNDRIYIMNKSNKDRLHLLKRQYGVKILEALEDISNADLLILAIKPKDAEAAMTAIVPYMQPHTAVLSVLAGTGMKTIRAILGNRPIARAMPNTSATIGMSATGIAFNEEVTAELKTLFFNLLNAVGIVEEVKEDQLHAITALSGSGPAYIYYLLEAFEKVGTELGLEEDIVRRLMVQTIAGSASMLHSLQLEPADLRRKVTSSGGTTEAGIHALEQHHFTEAITACIKSAETRSRELANKK